MISKITRLHFAFRWPEDGSVSPSTNCPACIKDMPTETKWSFCAFNSFFFFFLIFPSTGTAQIGVVGQGLNLKSDKSKFRF